MVSETTKAEKQQQSSFNDGTGITIDQNLLQTRNEFENQDLVIEIKFVNEEENKSKYEDRKAEIMKRIKMTAGFKKEPQVLKNQNKLSSIAKSIYSKKESD